jgi:hypothetical protein
MDKIDLVIANLIVLVLCLVIYLNNALNNIRQPVILKIVFIVSLCANIYLFNSLDKTESDCIWGIGGSVEGGDINGGETGSDLIVQN